LIPSTYLQTARAALRSYLRLPEDEIVDLVFFASVLCNFDPHRDLPIWLVVVGSPSSGKTDITSLIRDWRPVWPLPAKLSAGYFFSSRTGKHSTLHEIDESGARILLMDDFIGLQSVDYRDAGSLYPILIGLHDGHLQHRTGLTSETMVYGPKAPHDRLGFIASATEKFYSFQERWFQFGSRFMCYFLPDVRQSWDDYGHLTMIHDQSGDAAMRRAYAKQCAQELLDHVIANIDSFAGVTLRHDDIDRLSAAVTFVQRVLGAGRSADPGVRLHKRTVLMTRMMAFMHGRTEGDLEDVANGIRIILSQLPMHEHKILRFALEQLPGGPWKFGDLLEYVGSTRKIYSEPLEALADVRVLRRGGDRGAKGYHFELHPKALALVDVFDPEKAIFPR